MANFRRSKPACRTYHRPRWGKEPRYWKIAFHRRPKRRWTKAAEHAVVCGADPDAIHWPHKSRPWQYYW